MSFDTDWLQAEFPDVEGIGQIGKGGQKSVFGGVHPQDGPIVMKLFKLGSDGNRAEREVAAARTVKSERVPEILAHGVITTPIGEVIWIRERRIEGVDLQTRLASGPLAQQDAILLTLHILEALAASESVRIVHRDVKPGNILCDTSGGFWLLDFGLARHLDLVSLTATAAHFGCGTPGYSPAEQFRNMKGDIDARADLFALGVTVYESLVGENPFLKRARDVSDVLRRVETQPLPAIPIRTPGGESFRDLILAMTRPRRDQRIESAADALQWVREISDDGA